MKKFKRISFSLLVSIFAMYLFLSSVVGVYADVFIPEEAEAQQTSEFPEKFDLRDYGLVSRAKDQGRFGTCWTFGGLGSIESTMFQQFPNIDFSNAHVAYFFSKGGEADHATSSAPYEGGNVYYFTSTLGAWQGVIYSDDLPYSTNAGKELDPELMYKSEYHLQNTLIYDDDDLEVEKANVKKALTTYGAVQLAYYHNHSIINENNAYYSAIPNGERNGNHAVLIVGWDDNYPKENFGNDGDPYSRPKNDGAWIIRNSWNSDWGDEGFFYLSYEDTSISDLSSSFVEDNDNYTTNYQYDTTHQIVFTDVKNYKSNINETLYTAYTSNVFTAEKDEQLEAVSFWTKEQDAEYEISIYKGVEDDPTSGERVYQSQSQVMPIRGYHTVKLDYAIPVTEGEKFSVIIKITQKKSPDIIAQESLVVDASLEDQYATDSLGESYISTDGENWVDAHSVTYPNSKEAIVFTNCCIKAFANPVTEEGISNVRFSLFKGPVAYGSELRLFGDKDTDIMYSVNGGAPVKYEGKILLDEALFESEECEISAWGERNGKKGNEVKKTFTKMQSRLTGMTVYLSSGKTIFCDVAHDTDYNLDISPADKVSFKFYAQDGITVNGDAVKSNTKSGEYELSEGKNIFAVKVKDENGNKTEKTYNITLNISYVNIDFVNETASYDTERFELYDGNGVKVESGSSIFSYIVNSDDSEKDRKLAEKLNVLYLRQKESGELVEEITVPTRSGVKIAIDTAQMATDGYINADCDIYSPEISRWVSCKDVSFELIYLPNVSRPGVYYIEKNSATVAYLGEYVLLRKNASNKDRNFTSVPLNVFGKFTENLADAPEIDQNAVKKGIDYIKLPEIDGVEYSIDNGASWGGPVFNKLKMGTKYTVLARRSATATAFPSKNVSFDVMTLYGIKVPVWGVYANGYYMLGSVTLESGKETTVDLDYVLNEIGDAVYAEGIKITDMEGEYKVNVFDVLGTVYSDTNIIYVNMEHIEYDYKDPSKYKTVNLSDIPYNVYFYDMNGDYIGSSTEYFDSYGNADIERITIPKGYSLAGFIDNRLSKDYGYMPYLQFIYGKWVVLDSKAVVILQKTPSIKVEFVLPNGTVLTEYSYEQELNGSNNTEILVLSPEHCRIIGESTFPIKLTLNEAGEYVSDVDTIRVSVELVHENEQDHSYELKLDDDKHWYECLCGAVKEQEEHEFVQKFDSEKHYSECSCGKRIDEASHELTTNVTENTHSSVCSCGYIEGEAKHEFSGSYDENGHFNICKCGFVKDEESHSFTLEHDTAQHFSICKCGFKKDAELHSFEPKHDAENHWHECSCGRKVEIIPHTFLWSVDKEAEVGSNGEKHEECVICGEIRSAGTVIPALPEKEQSTDNSAAPDTNEENETEQPTAPVTAEDKDHDDGCKSSVSMTFISFISAISVLGAAVVKKKH